MSWRKVALHLIAIVGVGALLSAIVARQHEAGFHRLVDDLRVRGEGSLPSSVSFEGLEALPPPVARYLRFALSEGQPFFRRAELRQTGTLRVAPSLEESPRPFKAREVLTAQPTGFVWDARVPVVSGAPISLCVRDASINGGAAAEVRLISALRLAEAASSDELDEASLMRYLAETPWLPTALHPATGVEWSPMDDNHARARLQVAGVVAELEFEFADSGEIVSVYSPARPMHTKAGFERMPWRCRHDDYHSVQGMQVPTSGSVAWELADGPVTVWRGVNQDMRFDTE